MNELIGKVFEVREHPFGPIIGSLYIDTIKSNKIFTKWTAKNNKHNNKYFGYNLSRTFSSVDELYHFIKPSNININYTKTNGFFCAKLYEGQILSGHHGRTLYRYEKFSDKFYDSHNPGLYFVENLTELAPYQRGDIILECELENFYYLKPTGIAQYRTFTKAYQVDWRKFCKDKNISYSEDFGNIKCPLGLCEYIGVSIDNVFDASNKRELYIERNLNFEQEIRKYMTQLTLKDQNILEVV